MKPKVINTLSVRLIISLSILLIILLSIYTYFILNHLTNYLTESRFQTSYNISEIIKKSTRHDMLLNRPEDVHSIIKTLRSLKGVEEIRIYNKQGIISYSTIPSEINNKVDLTAEACVGCHNSSVPLQSLTNHDRIRVYKNDENNRVLGLINPIMNEPDCSNAACHAHPKDVNILGVLDVGVSLEGLDTIIQKSTSNVIFTSIFLVIVISLFSGLFITNLVNKPIKIIREGLEAVGNGNLDYKIEIQAKNELGQVARRFNEMSSNLAEAYQEIKNWSETLNDKVKEKTKELKNIYNQVNQIEKLASLGKLSATVAHELNNPLAGILTFSKLISKKLRAVQKDNEYESIFEYLDLISKESSRCGQIVKDLLIFSHSEHDKFLKENLVQIIDSAVTLIRHHLEISGITLIKDYSEEPIEIYCNANKIQQALMSLLINSIEAMSSNIGKIKINIVKENNNVVIRIIDEGNGIDEKDLPNIFEPFYSTKEESGGTGLGLAVVYGIVAHHKGKIEVEETSNMGTTFKLTLPQNEQLC